MRRKQIQLLTELFVTLAALCLFQSLAAAQEKHALLVIGELTLPGEKEQIANNLLTARGYIVHPLRPHSQGEVLAEVGRLAAISQDPNTPAWDHFVFYFIGHGGGGLMALSDENDKESGTVFTDIIALAIFDDIYTDVFTFVFDMCEAFLATSHVWTAEGNSQNVPLGWIFSASGTPALADEGSTYGTLYTEALSDCLGSAGTPTPAADVLSQCLQNERWNKPWWYKSFTRVSKVDLVQPDSVPVF